MHIFYLELINIDQMHLPSMYFSNNSKNQPCLIKILIIAETHLFTVTGNLLSDHVYENFNTLLNWREMFKLYRQVLKNENSDEKGHILDKAF